MSQQRLQHRDVPCMLKTVKGLEAAVKAKVSSFWRPDLLTTAFEDSSLVFNRSQMVVAATPKWALLSFLRRSARSFILNKEPHEWARWRTCFRSLLLLLLRRSQLLTLVVSSRSNVRLFRRRRCNVGFTISNTTSSLLLRNSDISLRSFWWSSPASATVVETLSEMSPSSPSSSSSLPDLLHSSWKFK